MSRSLMLAATLLAGSAAAAPTSPTEPTPFVLEQDLAAFPESAPLSGGRLADLDGDGRSELLLASGSTLSVLRLDGRPVWTRDFPEPIGVSWTGDADGDGRMDIALSTRRGERLVAHFVDADGHDMGHLEAAGGSSMGRPDGSIQVVAVEDLDGDGRREVVTLQNAGYSWKPRGVYVYAWGEGDALWHHATGPSAGPLAIADLDGDGRKELVLGSYGPGNGNSAPDGSDDVHAYVWCLSATGEVRWRRTTGTHFTGVRVATVDLDGDGRPEILTWTHAARDFRPDEGRIERLRADGTEEAALDLGRSIVGIETADLDGDGVIEVIAGDVGGTLRALDADLRVLWTVAPGGDGEVNVSLRGVADLDRDGRPEVAALVYERVPIVTNCRSDSGPRPVTHFRAPRVLTWSADGKALGILRLGDLWEQWPALDVRIADLDGDTRAELLVLERSLRVYTPKPRHRTL